MRRRQIAALVVAYQVIIAFLPWLMISATALWVCMFVQTSQPVGDGFDADGTRLLTRNPRTLRHPRWDGLGRLGRLGRFSGN